MTLIHLDGNQHYLYRKRGHLFKFIDKIFRREEDILLDNIMNDFLALIIICFFEFLPIK